LKEAFASFNRRIRGQTHGGVKNLKADFGRSAAVPSRSVSSRSSAGNPRARFDFGCAAAGDSRAPLIFESAARQSSFSLRWWVWLFLSCRLTSAAAEFDESKLPPPAQKTVDFTRDIKPVLDASCLRCHGPEKPKSRFRLDNREAALKGGENGVDIIPSDSAKSPLIYYVARLKQDMEMPPPGKGDPLTTQQVALLRAWIDQGVTWNAPPPTNDWVFSIAPIFGGTFVHGDSHQFREHYWQREGINGGLEQFEFFDRKDPETKLRFAGHALRDDFKLSLDLDRNEVGFVHSGFEQYRKYFDDTGGYFPSSGRPPSSLGRDLHLDIGKAWIDFGLTLPKWPRLVVGYEYDYKRGEEATTTWDLSPGALPNLAPASKQIREGTHVVKFDLDAEVGGVAVEERFRGEFYRLNTFRTNSDTRSASSEHVTESDHYFQGANTLRLEKQFTDWLLASGGYLYSKLNADATFTDNISNGGVPSLAQAPQISLERHSHIFNLNGLVGPFSGLTLSAGAQGEWTRQQGLGSGNLNQINSMGPIASLPTVFSTLVSDYDQRSVLENVALRYTRIPFTVLFAEARLQQQSIGQSDADFQSAGNFLENPAYSSQLIDLRAGFHTSPWRKVSFSAHYRRYDDDSRSQKGPSNQPPGGYPGVIRSRELLTDEAEAKLSLQPTGWLKTTLAYRYLTTSYWTDTDPAFNPGPPVPITPGGKLRAGRDDAQIFSIDAAFSLIRRLYLTTTFSYQPTTTTTADNGSAFVTRYRGDIYSTIASASYGLSDTMDLFASYSFSRADYGQHISAVILPLGIQYEQHAARAGLTRRLGKNVTTKLQYGYYYYDEPSRGTANNYTAHSIFGIITWRLP